MAFFIFKLSATHTVAVLEKIKFSALFNRYKVEMWRNFHIFFALAELFFQLSKIFTLLSQVQCPFKASSRWCAITVKEKVQKYWENLLNFHLIRLERRCVRAQNLISVSSLSLFPKVLKDFLLFFIVFTEFSYLVSNFPRENSPWFSFHFKFFPCETFNENCSLSYSNFLPNLLEKY